MCSQLEAWFPGKPRLHWIRLRRVRLVLGQGLAGKINQPKGALVPSGLLSYPKVDLNIGFCVLGKATTPVVECEYLGFRDTGPIEPLPILRACLGMVQPKLGILLGRGF